MPFIQISIFGWFLVTHLLLIINTNTCAFYKQSLLLFYFFLSVTAVAQQPAATDIHDTTYYKNYPGSVTTRFYFSQKYTAFTIQDKEAKDLQYQPNTTLNMGVGATYHNFSLNLAYGFGFLNQDDDKGKTKYLDLQGHFYKPKTVIDFYGQLYKGYHLSPKGFAENNADDYYYRHDAKINLFGLSAYRIFNSNRFSYRAAIIQNEWQKKICRYFFSRRRSVLWYNESRQCVGAGCTCK